MDRKQRMYWGCSLAASVLIAFQGICHEAVGARVFPFGPELFGGWLGWHLFGFLITGVGVWFTIAVIRERYRFVSGTALVLAPVGAYIFGYTALVESGFHVFALTGTISAVVVAVCVRRLERTGRAGGPAE